MATTQSNIKVTVVGDANQFSREMKSAESSLERVERQIDQMNRGFKAVKWGAIGGAAALGFSKLASGLTEVTKAAIEDRKEQTALNKVLTNLPGISKKAIAANEQWIDSMELATHVSDTDYRKAVARLTVSTGDLAEAQKLAALAADVAAGKGVNYTKALKEVEKAAKGGSKEVNKLEDAYGGAAKAAADTDPFTKIQKIWGQLKESLGKVLLPLLDKFAGWFKKPANKKAVQDFITKVGEVAEGLGTKLVDALKNVDWQKLKDDLQDIGEKFQTAAGYVTGLWDAFQNLPPAVKDNLEKIAAVLAAYTLASRVPGLKILLDWNEQAVKRTLDRVFGTSLAASTVRMTAGAVYITGPVAGGGTPGRSPRTPDSDPATNAALRAELQTYARTQDQIKETEMKAWVTGKDRVLEAEVKGYARAQDAALKATHEADIAVEKAARIKGDVDVDLSLKEFGSGKNMWSRIVSHVPVVGDLVMLGADLIALTTLFGKDGRYAYTKPESERDFKAWTDSHRNERNQSLNQQKGYLEGYADTGDTRVQNNSYGRTDTKVGTEEVERKAADDHIKSVADEARNEAMRARAAAGLPRDSNGNPIPRNANPQMAPMSYQQVDTSYAARSRLGNTYNIEINNQYPEPEKASDNLAMSLRIARYTLGVA